MTALTKRATVYLEPALHKAIRLKSVETSRSVSELVNATLRDELAEDAADLNAFAARRHEPTLSFEEFVKGLKRDGKMKCASANRWPGIWTRFRNGRFAGSSLPSGDWPPIPVPRRR